jgi:hypothetical protein
VNSNVKTRIEYDGKEYSDVMSVIENNGEVTLPPGRPLEPLFTKRQRQVAQVIVWALIFSGLLVVAKVIS